jgi:hypothetical protein
MAGPLSHNLIGILAFSSLIRLVFKNMLLLLVLLL